MNALDYETAGLMRHLWTKSRMFGHDPVALDDDLEKRLADRFAYVNWPTGAPYDWSPAERGGNEYDAIDFAVDLGCGKLKKGRIGIDHFDADGVDLLLDLNRLAVPTYEAAVPHKDAWQEIGRLPFATSSIKSIVSHHCSPADELVATTAGPVPIGELENSGVRLAGAARCHLALTWGGGRGAKPGSYPIKDRGYTFEMATRPYSGPLVCLETKTTQTRVTPNHIVFARLRQNFFHKHVVYLMRRGGWWRIGSTMTRRVGRGSSSGLMSRKSCERPDAMWILGVFETRDEARLEEMRLQAEYGITGAVFTQGGTKSIPLKALHGMHDRLAVNSTARACKVLADHGLLIDQPLFTKLGFRLGLSFQTAAANLLPLARFVDVPTASADFMGLKIGSERAEMRETLVSTEDFHGDVFSLDVPPHHHYVSGGAVVHNCLEHVGDGFLRLMNECYRVLEPGGIFRIIVPLFPSWSAVSDPDHRRYFMAVDDGPSTFDSLCGTPDNCWLESFSVPYTTARFEKVHQDLTAAPEDPALYWTPEDSRELRVALKAMK